MPFLIAILIAINLFPANTGSISIDWGKNEIITLESQPDGGWIAGDKTIYYAKGSTLTINYTNNNKRTIDFSEVCSITIDTDWNALNEVNMKGQSFLKITRNNNGALITFTPPEAEGLSARIAWTISDTGKDDSNKNLLSILVESQKDQKAILKQLFMSGADIGQYSIKLYSQNSKEFDEYHGGSDFKHQEKQILLYAGADLPQLKFDLAHETSHLILYKLAMGVGYTNPFGRPDKVPPWLNEGIAEFGAIYWTEKRHPGTYTFNKNLNSFREFVRQGNNPVEILDVAMQKTDWTSIKELEYPALGTFMEYIYEKCGKSKTIVSIWIEAAEGAEGIDINSTFEFHTGKTMNQLKNGWKEFLKNKYMF